MAEMGRVDEAGEVREQKDGPQPPAGHGDGDSCRDGMLLAQRRCKLAAKRVTLQHWCNSCMASRVHEGWGARCLVEWWCSTRWLVEGQVMMPRPILIRGGCGKK